IVGYIPQLSDLPLVAWFTPSISACGLGRVSNAPTSRMKPQKAFKIAQIRKWTASSLVFTLSSRQNLLLSKMAPRIWRRSSPSTRELWGLVDLRLTIAIILGKRSPMTTDAHFRKALTTSPDSLATLLLAASQSMSTANINMLHPLQGTIFPFDKSSLMWMKILFSHTSRFAPRINL